MDKGQQVSYHRSASHVPPDHIPLRYHTARQRDPRKPSVGPMNAQPTGCSPRGPVLHSMQGMGAMQAASRSAMFDNLLALASESVRYR